MPDDSGHVREEIGALREAVNNHSRTIDTLTRTWAEQDRLATERDRELERKFDELRNKIENKDHHNAGFKSALWLVWSFVAAGAAAVAWMIHDWAGLIIGLLWPPKHL